MEPWNRLIDALGDAAAQLKLGPGATPRAIKAAEQELGFALPDDYRAWLAIANGQALHGLSILPNGGWLISLERLLDQWRYERGHDLEDADYAAIDVTQDRDRIRSFIFHPRRLVIGGAAHLDYDNTLLDLIPGPAGTVGQVIVFITECDYVTLAPGLGAFFDRVAELVEARQLAPRPQEDDLGPALFSADGGTWNALVRGDKPRSRIKVKKAVANKLPVAKKPAKKR